MIRTVAKKKKYSVFLFVYNKYILYIYTYLFNVYSLLVSFFINFLFLFFVSLAKTNVLFPIASSYLDHLLDYKKNIQITQDSISQVEQYTSFCSYLLLLTNKIKKKRTEFIFLATVE